MPSCNSHDYPVFHMETITVKRTLYDTDYCALSFHVSTTSKGKVSAQISNVEVEGVVLTLYYGGETVQECKFSYRLHPDSEFAFENSKRFYIVADKLENAEKAVFNFQISAFAGKGRQK